MVKYGSRFPSYWSPHNLFTICKLLPTTGGSFSTYLGCSTPVRFVSLFNSLFRNFVGGFAWGTQLTPGDAVKGCTKVECIKRENRINRKVFLFAIMNLSCPISVHIYCLLLFNCCCLFSCVLFIVCGMQYRSWFCCSHCFLMLFRYNISHSMSLMYWKSHVSTSKLFVNWSVCQPTHSHTSIY